MNDIAPTLREYVELKREQKRIEESLEKLNPIIKEYLVTSRVDKLPTQLGTFTLGTRTVWKFSPAVEALQKAEKAGGIAKKVESTYLLFKEKQNGDQ